MIGHSGTEAAPRDLIDRRGDERQRRHRPPSIAASDTSTTRRVSSTVEMNGINRRSNTQIRELDQQRVAYRLRADTRAVGQENTGTTRRDPVLTGCHGFLRGRGHGQTAAETLTAATISWCNSGAGRSPSIWITNGP